MEIYENIFSQNKASLAMLTRMAFISEGLGNYSDALFYLNLYYDRTNDKNALIKIQEIADEHQLAGYESNDFKFITGFLNQHQPIITGLLCAFSAFLMYYSIRKKKRQEQPITPAILQVLTLAALLATSNQLLTREAAIISTDRSLLMSGPSGAAEPVDFIERGNKVTLLKTDELWSKILVGDQEAFIRNKNLRKL